MNTINEGLGKTEVLCTEKWHWEPLMYFIKIIPSVIQQSDE